MNTINILKKVYQIAKHATLIIWLVILLEGCSNTTAEPTEPTAEPTEQPTAEPTEQPTGQLRFLFDGAPLRSKGDLRVRCYQTEDPSTLLQSIDENNITINSQTGEVRVPENCNYLAIFYKPPAWQQDTNKVSFSIYATNIEQGQGIPTSATNGDIDLSNKFTAFNIVASIEWQPDVEFINDLKDGLTNASAYLFDVTDGQMAFQSIEIYADGKNWDTADLQFLAANDRRPSAFVGGIVRQSIEYTSPVNDRETTFSPGRILLGRYWNGDDASSGNWAEPNAYRTIIHEWGHYALFLYDEYLHFGPEANRDMKYCTCDDLPSGACTGSIMAYQYPADADNDGTPDMDSASELWHPNDMPSPPPSNSCSASLQGYVHGDSDWDTLGRWGEMQGLEDSSDPSSNPLEPLSIPDTVAMGPYNLGVLGDLLPLEIQDRTQDPNTIPVQNSIRLLSETFAVELSNNWNLPVTQSYTIRDDGQILHQGEVQRTGSKSGTIQLLGPPTDDKIWISSDLYNIDDLPGTGARYTAVGSTNTSSQPLQESLDQWNADLDLIYTVDSNSKFIALKVRISDNSPVTPVVQLCAPDIKFAESRCTQPLINMVPVGQNTGENTWELTFRTEGPLGPNANAPQFYGVEELPLYGLIRVRGGLNGNDELIRWYEDGRPPGPAHMGGDAPGVDGSVMVNTLDLPAPSCSRVFIMPATDFQAISTSINATNDTGQPIQGIIGTPLDIDILIPDNCPTAPSGPDQDFGDHDLPVPVTLNMFYPKPRLTLIEYDTSSTGLTGSLQPVAFQLGNGTIDPENLRLLHYNRNTAEWIVYDYGDIRDTDANLAWIAQEIDTDGIYAIGWVQP